MASVEINNQLGSSATRDGHLIIKDGLPISSSLQIVADEFNTSSTLQLSTLSAKVDSDFYVSGNVGIGTDSPTNKLEVFQSAAGEVVTLRSTSGNTGNVGMRFSIADASVVTDNFHKGAIFFEGSSPSNARGDMLFALNNTASSVNVSTSDEKMRITREGNVGIGTSTPDRQLQIHEASSGSSFAKFTNNATGTSGDTGFFVGINSAEEPVLFGYNATDMVFGTNGIEKMRIESGGNVGIGTSSPDRKLTVHNAASSVIADFKYTAGGFSSINLSNTTGSASIASIANDLSIAPAGTERMRITNTGNVGIGTSTPTRKLEVNGDVETGDIVCNTAIYLGGVAASNALDDYEEGTFTPTTAGDATGAFSSVVGEYTKIGNVVNFRLIASVTANFSSNIIGGLPFTVAGSPVPSGVASSINISNDNTANLNGFIVVGSNTIGIYSDHITTNPINPSTGMGILRMFGTYRV